MKLRWWTAGSCLLFLAMIGSSGHAFAREIDDSRIFQGDCRIAALVGTKTHAASTPDAADIAKDLRKKSYGNMSGDTPSLPLPDGSSETLPQDEVPFYQGDPPDIRTGPDWLPFIPDELIDFEPEQDLPPRVPLPGNLLFPEDFPTD